jgi:hypothetical protein
MGEIYKRKERLCKHKKGFSIQIDNCFEWLYSPLDLISIEVAKFPQKKAYVYVRERESVCVSCVGVNASISLL